MSNPPIIIRSATTQDTDAWLALRCGLWPETPSSQHLNDISAFFAGTTLEPLAVLLAMAPEHQAVGLAELSLRSYAEGCDSQPVAYLEGWYVVPERRGQGIGRSLIQAAEAWGRSQGCTEFASDAEADNDLSRLVHGAIGFEEVGLIRCFRKTL